ncbi:uncharacterized protein LOC120356024, partial [Nilaparvata lugens]|uniref:uncharacterized protein LOC120356024 n=1 Tax=Nilaparvata lugens TaxID=108931 RepID=UPI00193D1E76
LNKHKNDAQAVALSERNLESVQTWLNANELFINKAKTTTVTFRLKKGSATNDTDYHPLENVTLPDNRQRPYGSPTVAWNPWNDLRERDDIAKLKLLFPFQPMPVDWMKRIIQSYNAAVTYIDELVGELLLTLENEGLDNNTIVALIGDHGWSLGEHGEWSKFSNYEVATRVPFILKVPQLQQKGKHLNQEQKDQNLWIQKRKSEQGLHTGQKKLEQLNQEQKDQDLWIQKRKSEEGLLTGQKKLEQQKQEQKDQDLWIQKRKSEQGLLTGQKKLEQQSKEQEKKWRVRNELVELVDLFPTLVELAGFDPLEKCSTGEKQQLLCTEGNSLVPLLLQENSVNPTTAKWKRAAFSQYPRPSLYPTLKPNSDRPRLSEIAVMGYTMRTDRYRYTEWVRFKPNGSILSTISNRYSIHENISNGSSSSIHENTSNGSSDPEVVSSIHEKTSIGSSDPEVVSSIHENTSNGFSYPEVVSFIHEKTSNSSSSPEMVNESSAPEVASNGSSFSEVTPDWPSASQVTPDWSSTPQVTPDWSTVRQVSPDWFSAHQVPSDWSIASKMSSDWFSTPEMSSDWSSAPEMSPDWSSTPEMSSDWSSAPEMSPDWSSAPEMSPDWSSTPEMSSDWSSAAKLGPDWSVVYACELYDHAIDSEESINLADRPQLAALRRQLSEQLRRGWRGSQ